MTHTAIRLNAGNDRNGNPRRVYVVMNSKTGDIVQAIDEEYSGIAALTSVYPEFKNIFPATFDTSPAEYKNLIKNFSK